MFVKWEYKIWETVLPINQNANGKQVKHISDEFKNRQTKASTMLRKKNKNVALNRKLKN